MPKSYLAALLRRRWLVGGGYPQAVAALTCERMDEKMAHYVPHNSAASRRRAARVTAGDWGRVTSFFEMSGELHELVRGARREKIMQQDFFSTPGDTWGNEVRTDARWPARSPKCRDIGATGCAPPPASQSCSRLSFPLRETAGATKYDQTRAGQAVGVGAAAAGDAARKFGRLQQGTAVSRRRPGSGVVAAHSAPFRRGRRERCVARMAGARWTDPAAGIHGLLEPGARRRIEPAGPDPGDVPRRAKRNPRVELLRGDDRVARGERGRGAQGTAVDRHRGRVHGHPWAHRGRPGGDRDRAFHGTGAAFARPPERIVRARRAGAFHGAQEAARVSRQRRHSGPFSPRAGGRLAHSRAGPNAIRLQRPVVPSVGAAHGRSAHRGLLPGAGNYPRGRGSGPRGWQSQARSGREGNRIQAVDRRGSRAACAAADRFPAKVLPAVGV